MVKIAFTIRLKQYHQLIKSVKSKLYFVRISSENNLTFAWDNISWEIVLEHILNLL